MTGRLFVYLTGAGLAVLALRSALAVVAALAYPIVPFVPLPPLAQEPAANLALASRLEPLHAELALVAGSSAEKRWLNQTTANADRIGPYRRASELSPANPFPRLFEARFRILQAARQGVELAGFKTALEDLELAGQLAPRDAIAATLAAKLYMDLWPALSERGRGVALARVRQAILANPAMSDKLLDRVWSASRRPQDLLRVLADEPQSRLIVAGRMIALGRIREAWQLLDQSCSAGVAWNWSFVTALDELRRDMGPERFLEGLALLIERCPREPACWAARAAALDQKGDLEGSELAKQRAAHWAVARAGKLDRPIPPQVREACKYYLNSIWDHHHSRVQHQKLARSVAEYESVLGRDGRSAFFMALARELSGRSEEAIDLYREAVTLGEAELSQPYLADLLYREHRYVEATREWRNILAYRPENHAIRGRLVETYYLLGDVATARAVASGG